MDAYVKTGYDEPMSLRDAVYFALRHSRKEGNFIPKLVNSEYWDTPIGMRMVGCRFYYPSYSETDWIDAWILPSIDEFCDVSA